MTPSDGAAAGVNERSFGCEAVFVAGGRWNEFAQYKIGAIAHGVHAGTWVSPPFAVLFVRWNTLWRGDNFDLRHALGIPDNDLWQAHQEAKRSRVWHVVPIYCSFLFIARSGCS